MLSSGRRTAPTRSAGLGIVAAVALHPGRGKGVAGDDEAAGAALAALIQAAAAVFRSGRGDHNARATGSFGSGCSDVTDASGIRQRVDEVIIFDRLSSDEIKQIAALQVNRLAKRLAAQNITLEVTPAALALVSPIPARPGKMTP